MARSLKLKDTKGVENLDAMIKRMAANGGECLVPKKPIPQVGWFAYCKDTEGNLFGFMQMDANAK